MVATVLRTRDGKLDAADEKVFAAFQKRVAEGQPKILLHLHGGLVDQASAEAMATRLSGSGPSSYGNPSGWEQVYIVWRTGAFETLRTNWKDLAENDRLYNVVLRKLLEYVGDKIHPPGVGSRSVGFTKGLSAAEINARLQSGVDAPFKDVDEVVIDGASGRSVAIVSDEAEDELKAQLEKDTEIEAVALDIEAAAAEGHPIAARAGMVGDAEAGRESLKRLDPRIVAELDVEAAQISARGGIITGKLFFKIVKLVVKIGMRVIRRYRSGHDHGLHATITEEIARECYGDLIGSIVWGMMKSDGGEHFVGNGLGSRLLATIAASSNARLVIVAHSAGSIFASELLIWAAKRRIAFKADLVFLAPAVRAAKFAEALALSQERIGQFRMFAMSDALERADCLLGPKLGFIYPSSLLYLVSGLFEQVEAEGLVDAPLVGMQRFLGDDSVWLKDAREGPALKKVQDFLLAGPNKTVFSKAQGGDGLNCDSTSHGGFDDNPATLASVATYLR